MSQPALADDYELTEEEEKTIGEAEASEGTDFLKDFSCLIGSNRELEHLENIIKEHSNSPGFGVTYRRLRANLFKTCLEAIDDQTIAMVSQARSQEDFAQIAFPFFHEFDVPDFLASEVANPTSEERTFIRRLKGIEDKVKEMQKKHKRENPDQEEEDDGAWGASGGQKSQQGIFFLDMDNQVLLIAAVVMLAALAGLLLLIWRKLFNDGRISTKKDKKKFLKQSAKSYVEQKRTVAPREVHQKPKYIPLKK